MTSFYVEDDAPGNLVYGDGKSIYEIKLLSDIYSSPPITKFDQDTVMMTQDHTSFGLHCNRKYFVVVDSYYDVYD